MYHTHIFSSSCQQFWNSPPATGFLVSYQAREDLWSFGGARWEILTCLQSSRSGMQGHGAAYEPLIKKKRPLSLSLFFSLLLLLYLFLPYTLSLTICLTHEVLCFRLHFFFFFRASCSFFCEEKHILDSMLSISFTCKRVHTPSIDTFLAWRKDFWIFSWEYWMRRPKHLET